jgi:hypothetical protein
MRQLDADNIKSPVAPQAPKPEAAAPGTAKAAESLDETPVAETAEVTNEVAETAIPETSPIVTAGPVAPSPAGQNQSRYQMAPIADDADKPKVITPMGATVQKPVVPAPAASQPAQKQSTMLRKSLEAPISIANIAD